MSSLLKKSSIRFGYGCFETIKVYENGNIAFFSEHLERLANSCGYLNIDLECFGSISEEIKKYINDQTISSNSVLRLVKFKDEPIQYSLDQYNQSPNTVKLYLEKLPTIYSKDVLNQYKTCNYLKYILAKENAQQNGYDHALLINELGNIVETDRANIFFYKDNQWYTPPLSDGCLPGIVRDKIMKYLNAREKSISIADIQMYTKAFITNSLIDAVPVGNINHHKLDSVNVKDIQEMKNYLLSLNS